MLEFLFEHMSKVILNITFLISRIKLDILHRISPWVFFEPHNRDGCIEIKEMVYHFLPLNDCQQRFSVKYTIHRFIHF